VNARGSSDSKRYRGAPHVETLAGKCLRKIVLMVRPRDSGAGVRNGSITADEKVDDARQHHQDDGQSDCDDDLHHYAQLNDSLRESRQAPGPREETLGALQEQKTSDLQHREGWSGERQPRSRRTAPEACRDEGDEPGDRGGRRRKPELVPAAVSRFV
jgi:hypothetical protein